MSLDQRIFNRVAGYWPGYTMSEPALKAWNHKLSKTPTAEILDALDTFADEDLPTPPRAGQLIARIIAARPTEVEPEADRCRRQIREALQLRKDGNPYIDAESLRWYWDRYWSKHLPASGNPTRSTNDRPNPNHPRPESRRDDR